MVDKKKIFTQKTNNMTFKEWLKNNPHDLDATRIDCSWSELTDLDGIEDFLLLEDLHCYLNQLIRLPELPTCKHLQCGENQITQLPELPSCRVLYCGDNQITDLPELANCSLLNCENNQARHRSAK